MAVLIVGGTAVDIIFPRVPRIPAWPRHLEFTPDNLVLLPQPPLVSIGGNGANAAYVAARCGARVTLHSNLGADDLGKLAVGWLKQAGCRIARISPDRRTAVNVTAADARLRRATFYYSGERPEPPASAAGFRHALVCGWPHPERARLIRCLRAWRRQGIRTAYDAGPLLGGETAKLEGLRPLLAELDLFLVNEHEALALAGQSRLQGAVDRLRASFPGDLVIKLGRRGALWAPPGERRFFRFSGKRLRARNTVGAGDSFNGALLAALDRGASFPAAMRAANAAAARVVRSGRGVLGFVGPERAGGRG